jgi:protein-disulfide isomerase
MATLSRGRRLVVALGAAAALAAVLIGASRLGAGEKRAVPPLPQARPLAAIPQDGPVLGRPTAPVTLVEYADLQCPYCAEWTRRTLPVLVEDYVRSGRLRIVFRGLAFIGPDSDLALRTAVAAGRRHRLWDVLESLYRSQGAENSGWVTDALLADVAGRAGLDYAWLRRERDRPEVARRLQAGYAQARAAGVTGTPSFQLGRTGGRLDRVELRSLGPEGLAPAIERLLG